MTTALVYDRSFSYVVAFRSKKDRNVTMMLVPDNPLRRGCNSFINRLEVFMRKRILSVLLLGLPLLLGGTTLLAQQQPIDVCASQPFVFSYHPDPPGTWLIYLQPNSCIRLVIDHQCSCGPNPINNCCHVMVKDVNTSKIVHRWDWICDNFSENKEVPTCLYTARGGVFELSLDVCITERMRLECSTGPCADCLRIP